MCADCRIKCAPYDSSHVKVAVHWAFLAWLSMLLGFSSRFARNSLHVRHTASVTAGRKWVPVRVEPLVGPTYYDGDVP